MNGPTLPNTNNWISFAHNGVNGAAAAVSVVNNRWSVTANNISSGTYYVLVLNTNAEKDTLVTQEIVVTRSSQVSGGAMTCAFTATSAYDASGNPIPVTLSWSSQNANYAELMSRQLNVSLSTKIGTVGVNGTYSVNPNESTEYSLLFQGNSGSKECQVTVSIKG